MDYLPNDQSALIWFLQKSHQSLRGRHLWRAAVL